MYRKQYLYRSFDWPTVLLYLIMVTLGWVNIFAAVYDVQTHPNIFDFSINSGKQLIWIATTMVLIIFVLAIDYKFYESFAWPLYGFMLLLLLGVALGGQEIAGSRSWIRFGSFQVQPAEFAKFTTALALASYISRPGIRLTNLPSLVTALAIAFAPALLIIAQSETGSALVFAFLTIALYREGMPAFLPALGITIIILFVLTLLVAQLYLIIGLAVLALLIIFFIPKTIKNIGTMLIILALVIGVVMGVDYFINEILKPHQQNRIKVLINPNIDPLGVGWNVTQSKIAIGSGGLTGKGFLDGTQTKFDFVPEQSTDFIFCTIGEEHGWIGSVLILTLFACFILRVYFIAERQKSRFARSYGYCVGSIFFFHFLVNIGMTIGLMPVIGIPLPFFSYGGSSLWAFSILLFILLNLDVHRSQELNRG